jgi:hypothetical protein
MENKLITPLPHITYENESGCYGYWSLIYNFETDNIRAVCNECGTAFDIQFDITILQRPILKQSYSAEKVID